MNPDPRNGFNDELTKDTRMSSRIHATDRSWKAEYWTRRQRILNSHSEFSNELGINIGTEFEVTLDIGSIDNVRCY